MKRKEKVTLKTIAAQLGVSQITVSKALRDRPDIAPETKRQVVKLAQQLGYHSKSHLRKKSRQKSTLLIGAVLPQVESPFYADVVKAFHQIAGQKGYQVILMVSHEDIKTERRIFDTMSKLQVDGILAAVSQETRDPKPLQELAHQGIPLVFWERQLDVPDIPSVTFDEQRVAEMVVKHLIAQGKSKIAYLGPQSFSSLAKNRYQGYRQTIENNPFLTEWTISCKTNTTSSYSAVRAVLRHEPLPDAICCYNDRVALGAFNAIKEQGLDIPTDIALAGFGRFMGFNWMNVPITQVQRCGYKLGQKAVELLIEQINTRGAAEKNNVVLKSDIKVLPDSSAENEK